MSVITRMPTCVLVIEGGDLLGPYHIGAYRALLNMGLQPKWVCGSSIGAISAAIIAGNAPSDQVSRLLQLWDFVSERARFEASMGGRLRRLLGSAFNFAAGRTSEPNLLDRRWQRAFLTSLTPQAAVLQDTALLREALYRFVDFYRISTGETRLTLSATNAISGNLRLFDSRSVALHVDHVIASSASAPFSPRIRIDGIPYWDDEFGASTALEALVRDQPAGHTIVFVFDLWSGRGARPESNEDYPWRAKRILNANRVAAHIDAVATKVNLRHLLGEDSGFSARDLSAAASHHGEQEVERHLDVVHMVPPPAVQIPARGVQFLGGSIGELGGAGYRDMEKAIDVSGIGHRETQLGGAVLHRVEGEILTTRTETDLWSTTGWRESASAGPRVTPSFFFALEGAAARCDEVVWGAAFDLVFHYDLLPEAALAGIRGKRLGRLLQGNAALGIDIIPKGLLLVDGGAGRVATFQGGRMVGDPPRFRLKAPNKSVDVEPAPRGVQVVFTIAGSMIYNFFLEIRLVDVLGHDPCRTRVIDLDLQELAAIQVEPRTARLYIISKGDSWLIYGNIDGVELTPDLTSEISASKLDAAYSKVLLGQFTAIAGDAIWRNIDKDLRFPAEDEQAALACMKATVAAGWQLYRSFSADPVFKKALDLIDNLPNGSKITIVTSSSAFPWELFYPLQYVLDYPPENCRPEKFWGCRFVIESLLITTTEEEKLPPDHQQPGTLHVSMGLNSGIDNEPPWPGRPLLPVQFQKDYVDTALKVHGAYFDQYDAIFDTLRTGYRASLIYFFCHGAASQLKFDNSKSIFMPDHVMGESYPCWPIVFLNACDAADISPLSFFPFRTQFRKKKAAGLIAPSFPIPTLFAAVFAKAFLTRYADHEPVGEILLNLRRELLAKNNPLGLWYSLQCPLDVRAPEN
jgi:NTE family protein